MFEIAAIGGLTTLAVFFWYHWREEKARAKAWSEALQFAQKEVSRWKAEAEGWAARAEGGVSKLQETQFGLLNLEELFKRSSCPAVPRTE